MTDKALDLIHHVGWAISNAAAEEMRAQGFSGGWDHDALANNIAGTAVRATGAEEMRAALEHYATTYCEGWCAQIDRPSHLDCGGCLARSLLAQVGRYAKRQDPAEGLGPKDEHAVPQGCAQPLSSPSPSKDIS